MYSVRGWYFSEGVLHSEHFSVPGLQPLNSQQRIFVPKTAVNKWISFHFFTEMVTSYIFPHSMKLFKDFYDFLNEKYKWFGAAITSHINIGGEN